ncbi:MAG: PAS domain S-box protein, partial [Clostridia bacterium]|nr:PAS domain S-box protein [Clostridia bacterium]
MSDKMAKPDKDLLKIIEDSHEKYRFIAENSLDYIWILDKAGNHVYISPSIKQLRGLTPEEGLKERVEDSMTKESFEKLQAAIKKREEQEKLGTKEYINKLELQHTCKDGSLVWVELISKRIYNKNGKPIGILGISRNIDERKKAELILKEREKRFSTLVSNLPGMAYICSNDQNWTMKFISEGCFDLTGYPPSDFIDNKKLAFKDIIHVDDQEYISKTIEKTNINQKSYTLQYRIITKSKKIKWVWEQGVAIFNKDGKKEILEGMIIDISKQKEVERSLKESEEKYRKLIENSLQGLYIIKDNKILFCSKKMANIFGYNSAEEVNGLDVTELVHESSLETVLINIKNRISGKQKIAHYNFLAKKKNGETIEVETLGSKILLDGQPAIQGVLKDVTQQKASEERLRKLSQAVEQSPTSIVITDLKGVIEYVNPYFIYLTGYTAEEAIGKSTNILKSNHTPNEVYKDLWTTITSGKEWVGEILNRKKSGELYWESVKIAPIKDISGIITHFVGIKDDITDQKRIQNELILTKEKAIESDNLKTSFLANMSHEIRTPMNAIMGFSSLLSDESLTFEERDEFIQLINSNSNTLLNLIDDIIDIAKIEAGQLSVSNKDFDINELLSEINATYQEINTKQNEDSIKLIWDKNETDNISVINTDPHRLKQVLSNLIENAMKYTKEGEINFGYKLLKNINVGEKTKKLQFYVRDTGIGIPSNKLNVIFDRFRQADDSHTRIFGGTGLGLAISKNIAQLLGGDINVVSMENKGSVFYFTIPIIDKNKKLQKG